MIGITWIEDAVKQREIKKTVIVNNKCDKQSSIKGTTLIKVKIVEGINNVISAMSSSQIAKLVERPNLITLFEIMSEEGGEFIKPTKDTTSGLDSDVAERKIPMWVVLVTLAVALLLLGILVWKWKVVITLLTWPFHAVNTMLSTTVTASTPTAGLVTQTLAKLGLAQLPEVVVATYASTWYSITLGVLANVTYLAGLAFLIWKVYELLKPHD